MCITCAAPTRPVSRTLKSDIQFGNGRRIRHLVPWPLCQRVSKTERPALREENHINSRGIQLNGSKVLSKYDAAPKTSADRSEARNSRRGGEEGGYDMGGFGNKNAD